MKKLSLYAFLLLFATTTLFTSCGSDDDTPDPDPEPELNIIEWATDNGNYGLLLAGAEKAGLTPVLADPNNQYTIFGPPDPVFQGFLDVAAGGSLDNLTATQIGGILTNHALLGGRNVADLAQGYITNLGRVAFDTTGTITTSAYIDLTDGVAINGGTAATGGATVTTADLQASNGVIHEIGGVLVPPKLTTFVAVDPELTMTLAALSRSDLGVDYVAAAGGNDLFTVFAPTNAGWTKFLTDGGWATVNDVPAAEMSATISKHLIPGTNTRSIQLIDGGQLNNLGGTTLTLSVTGTVVTVNSASRAGVVTYADIQSQNGVIHKIDNVLD